MKSVKIIFVLILTTFTFISCEFFEFSTELTEKEKEQIITSDSIISAFADSALISTNPYEGLKQAAEKFKLMPQVEDIFFENNCLAVKYKKGGYIYYLITPNDSIDEAQNLPKFDNQIQKNNKIYFSDSTDAYPKILIVNQQSNDLSRSFLKYDLLNGLLLENGVNTKLVKGNAFDLNFLENEIKNYDGIFIHTHGVYIPKTKNTWLLTGQEANNKLQNLLEDERDYNFGEIDINRKEWIVNEKTIFHVNEKRTFSTLLPKFVVKYYAISNNFIEKEFETSDFNNSFFYFGACQSMMDPALKFAKALVSKGVKKVFGYDETTLTFNNYKTLVFHIDMLLKGYSTNSIFDSLPQDMKPQNYYENESKKDITCNIKTYPEDTDFSFNPLKLAQGKINSIISPEHIQLLRDMQMPVYDKGINPPSIDGVFKFSPVTLISTNITNDFKIGHVFNDVALQIKTKNKFFADIRDEDSGSFSDVKDMVIVGEAGKNFTIYSKSSSIKKTNSSVYIVLAELYSGTYENGTISNLNYGFVCVDDSHNDGTYVKKGSARVFVDGDYISEATNWSLVPGIKVNGSNDKINCTQAK